MDQFALCPQRLLSESDVNTECTISRRQALRSTASDGQGLFGCDCRQETVRYKQLQVLQSKSSL